MCVWWGGGSVVTRTAHGCLDAHGILSWVCEDCNSRSRFFRASEKAVRPFESLCEPESVVVVVLVLDVVAVLLVVSDELVWFEAVWLALIEANNPFNRSSPPPEPPEMESDIFCLRIFD